MSKQKIQLNYNKNHYTEQNKQQKNKDNIIKEKNQLNYNKHKCMSSINVNIRLTESFL